MPSEPRRFRYTQAFIKSPKFKFRLIEIKRISDGIMILEAVGEGTLLVCTKRRPPGAYYSMAEVDLKEVVGKSEGEVWSLLDRKTEEFIKRENTRIASRRGT